MIDTIDQHLQKYGLRHFAKVDDYTDWLESKLSADQIQEMHDSVFRLAREPNPENIRAIYDLIAGAQYGPRVLSHHTDVIKQSGLHVDTLLRGRREVLDVGCATGYLTTWYAISSPHGHVTGVDFSSKAIDFARAQAQRLGIANVQFHSLDITQAVPDGRFDAIVGAQCFEFLPDLDEVAGELVAHLKKDGILVSVTHSPHDLDIAESFQTAGLRVSPIRYFDARDLGETTSDQRQLLLLVSDN